MRQLFFGIPLPVRQNRAVAARVGLTSHVRPQIVDT